MSQQIIQKTADVFTWWIGKRREKLVDQLSETMSLNPFMVPFLIDYHALDNVEGLIDLIVASHLMTGHNTGFGKMVDEKLLPGGVHKATH